MRSHFALGRHLVGSIGVAMAAYLLRNRVFRASIEKYDGMIDHMRVNKLIEAGAGVLPENRIGSKNSIEKMRKQYKNKRKR